MKCIAKRIVWFVEQIERISPKIHVFHIEDVFVFLVLAITASFSMGNYIEWLGVLAVFLSFKHIVVAFRQEDVLERKEKDGDTAFNSHGKQTQYFYAKETVWFLYFFVLGAWSALIGVVIFLLYPIWHDVREKYHSKRQKNQV